MDKRIGIGVATYNRPDNYAGCIDSVLWYAPEGSSIYVSDDGSTHPNYDELFEMSEEDDVKVMRGKHANVATSKNRLLRAMMEDGMDYLFLIEDDMRALSKRAFTDYVDGFENWGMHHSMFAHHGTRNSDVGLDAAFSYHYECVGSWCFYSREAIETVGFMDEELENCWEHVIHSMLIGDAGLMPNAGWRKWPDVKNSINLITENPDSVSTHADKSDEDLMSEARVQAGLRHWKANYRFPEDIEELLQS